MADPDTGACHPTAGFLVFALPTFVFAEESPRTALPAPGMADLLQRLARS
ncbi:hypothetical protein BH23ACT5_BH23ACT5_03450 [soil metagenome]